MLWYLLTPFRGTTQPPRLSPSHPIRRAFYRHGKATARNWLLAMLFSIAVAMAVSYPTVLLSANPTAGVAAYPQHVWTSAKTINETGTVADLEMRQIWIYGSYMRALDKQVLQRGLAIQETLIGDNSPAQEHTLNASEDAASSGLQWGFHSPLMYWNNSAIILDVDDDILRTINDQKYHSSSSLNVVLRPASVFAGKRFDRRRLLAADALVITLLNRADQIKGAQWQNNVLSLTQGACQNCSFYPEGGQVTRHQVYEFSFTPMTLKENAALACAYVFVVIYVLLSLRRMKAFHSRFGLVVTAITQMTFCILASFTVCRILGINLATMPQSAYPFVVLVIGLENMFRLINAVLAYSPTMATDLRIANALGDIGPLSVATAAQNLSILLLLSAVVSPGVAAFCAFAAIATLFDVFFLHTFFVAVLNVDIRRLELQDAITARQHPVRQSRHHKRVSPSPYSWFDALVSGRLPFSTRMAGTAVTTTFILSLNYHFFEREETASSLRHMLGFSYTGLPSIADLDTFAPPPINASLTPGEWMRMQDFDTAMEIMKLAKNGADKFVMKIFAPLVVVLSNSDRAAALHEQEAWSYTLRSFTMHHFYPVAVAIVFGVTFVTVLMNFLLYSETIEETYEAELSESDDRLSVSSVVLPHRLDVVKMESNRSGHIVTAALDRTIAITTIDPLGQGHHTSRLPDEILQNLQWPIYDFALDDDGRWIACHCAGGKIVLYDTTLDPVTVISVPYPDDHPPVMFGFQRLPTTTEIKLYFIVVTAAGRLTMSRLEDQQLIGIDISFAPLLGAAIVDKGPGGCELIAITEHAELLVLGWVNSTWSPVKTHPLALSPSSNRSIGPVSIRMLADFEKGLLVLESTTFVIFVDAGTFEQVGRIALGEHQNLLDYLTPGALKRCEQCGGVALRQITSCTKDSDGSACTFTSWTSSDAEIEDQHDVSICVQGGSDGCVTFNNMIQESQQVEARGAWIALEAQMVLGLRKQKAQTDKKLPGGTATSSTRQRRHAQRRAQSTGVSEKWEAYRLRSNGDVEVVDVPADGPTRLSEPAPLFVENVGPAVPLDGSAIAVALGNTVKIVRSARRSSLSSQSRRASLERQPSTSRRRGIPRRTR